MLRTTIDDVSYSLENIKFKFYFFVNLEVLINYNCIFRIN